MRSKFWKKFILISLPLLALLGLAEMGLRLSGQPLPDRVLCFHPVYKNEYCANAQGSLQQGVPVKINSDGLIDSDYPASHDAETLRIAVLGDSSTAGEAVPTGKRYHELWEKWLPSRLGQKVEVINFGTQGFGTWESLQMYHLKAKDYQPDFTVLSFYWGDDVENNVKSLEEERLNPLKEEYQISFVSKLNLARKNFDKWLWNHSALYDLTCKSYSKVAIEVENFFADPEQPILVDTPSNTAKGPYALANQPGKFKIQSVIEDLETRFDDKFFFDSKGWHLTRGLIRQLDREVRSSGSRLLVVHFLDVEQIHNYPALPLKEFETFLEQERIPSLNLYPDFAALDSRELKTHVFENDSQFNTRGHRRLAETTIDFIVRQVLGSGRLT